MIRRTLPHGQYCWVSRMRVTSDLVGYVLETTVCPHINQDADYCSKYDERIEQEVKCAACKKEKKND